MGFSRRRLVKIKLAYGKSGLEVDFPDSGVDVIEPRFVPGLRDETAALREALRDPIGCCPIREMVSPEDTVAIIFSDRTRPMPSDRVLPAILSELESVPRSNITLINAVGTHRQNTAEELEAMLGRAVVDNFRIVQHRPKDRDSMVRLGVSRFGNEVWVNRDFMQAKIKVLTGFIEPHFFAGFSGGPKSVLLGVGAFESILRNHSARMIDNPNSTWGITEENPIHQEMSEIAALVKPDFIVNVTLNRHRQITGVFVGEWRQAHRRGCAFAKNCVMQPVEKPYDLVVTTNSGFPLDMNLYQAVKGMSAAARIVKQGGVIIAAAECSDGVPMHGNFRQLLLQGKSPQEWLESIYNAKENIPDQWQVQILAKILQKATVYLYSTLPEHEVLSAHLKPIRDIAACVGQLRDQFGQVNQTFRIAVLPEGPQTVPYLLNQEPTTA
jgi:nickel-dependent lactate racemase